MSFFGDLFEPLISLFVVTKGVEAAIPPSDDSDNNSSKSSDYWQSRVDNGPSNGLGM